MGTYRLVLALMVVTSHLRWFAFGHNQGVTAVVSFFLLSGYVMTALIEKYYDRIETLPKFAIDRALRLYPQFIFYLLAATALTCIFHQWGIFNHDLTFGTWVLNALMLPLGYYMFGFEHAQVLPPAWSLGLEFTFYAVFPFLLIYRARAIAFVLSLAFFIFATSGQIDADAWGYRLLPGTLFIFICGSYIRTADYRLPVIAWLVSLCLVAVWFIDPSYRIASNLEVFAGISIGIPAVWLLSKLRFSKIDELLGNMSYGVYLNHWVLLIIEGSMHISAVTVPHRLGLMAASVMLSYVTYRFVERPALMLRRRTRRGTKTDARSTTRGFPQAAAER